MGVIIGRIIAAIWRRTKWGQNAAATYDERNRISPLVVSLTGIGLVGGAIAIFALLR